MARGNTTRIRVDRPTVLMADDAMLTGRFTIRPERRRVKRFHVSGWANPDDTAEWLIDAPSNECFVVSALISAHGARLRLNTPGGSLEREIESGPTGWNRVEPVSGQVGTVPVSDLGEQVTGGGEVIRTAGSSHTDVVSEFCCVVDVAQTPRADVRGKGVEVEE